MSCRACVLTVSTKGARGQRVDESGEKISEALARIPADVVGRAIVSDELADIQRQIREWLRVTDPDLIVLTGGTGLGPRDVTPQAVEALLDYPVPGIAEAMRAAGRRKKAPPAPAPPPAGGGRRAPGVRPPRPPPRG